jgi:hypothetical protein
MACDAETLITVTAPATELYEVLIDDQTEVESWGTVSFTLGGPTEYSYSIVQQP